MKKRLDFSVHPFAAAGLFLLIFASAPAYAFAVLSSVFLHEMGHTVAALLLGKKMISVRIVPTGINITLSAPSSYTEELCIAAAGPLMNLLYALTAIVLPYSFGATVRTVSLFLGIFNLLPLTPLDGGRILCALFAPIFGTDRIRAVSSFFDLLLLSFLWIVALYIFFYSGVNFTLLLFCAYLFSYLVMKKF